LRFELYLKKYFRNKHGLVFTFSISKSIIIRIPVYNTLIIITVCLFNLKIEKQIKQVDGNNVTGVNCNQLKKQPIKTAYLFSIITRLEIPETD
jgi:hypothetical protein